MTPETEDTQTETVEYTIKVTADEDSQSEFEEVVREQGGEIVDQRNRPDLPLDVELPEYLQDLIAEAKEEYTDREDTTSSVAQEIAWNHEELYPQLQTNRRDYLQVLQDLRDHGVLCADELDYYRQSMCVSDPNSFQLAEGTLRAITRRSLEELIYEHLTEE